MIRKLLFISLLLYTLPALSAVIQRSSTDDVEFSSNGGVTYTYTPMPDADGYDSNVTHFRGLKRGEQPQLQFPVPGAGAIALLLSFTILAALASGHRKALVVAVDKQESR